MLFFKRPCAGLRSGSVLILTVSLLVLLALLGTAILASNRTERYASRQDSMNTEAELLLNGLVCLTSERIPQALYGPRGQSGPMRPASQAMLIARSSVTDDYLSYSSPTSELLLADRIPSISSENGQVSWRSISWPLYSDSSGGYTFQSPFGESTSLYSAANKALLQAQPAYRTVNGKVLPGLIFYLPPENVSKFAPALAPTDTGYYITPSGPIDAATIGTNLQANYSRLVTIGASASGDGIADSGLSPLPVGPINGITYYAAIRLIDQNSAINATTAWRSDADPTSPDTTAPNYGYFRSNIGLQELLVPSSAAEEMQNLNALRFGQADATLPATISLVPYDDIGNLRSDFQFASYGDAIDSQLARRPSATGKNGLTQKFAGFNSVDSMALAARFSLVSSTAGSTVLERVFSNECVNSPSARASAYSPMEVKTWYSNSFDYSPSSSTGFNGSIRPLLVGSNPVSNGIASRFGNLSPFTHTPLSWSASAQYQFGDWVIGPDLRSYICLVPNSNYSPITQTINQTEYWAEMPFATTPVKASANTSTFEQLWLAYCHVMTDNQTPATAGSAAQWLPPMRPQSSGINSPEPQVTMFRSVVRDNRYWPVSAGSVERVQLTPMQMMQLRAGIAAVNTLQLRNSPDIQSAANSRHVISRHIVLSDTAGKPAYDVELFGNDIQPYIAGLYVKISKGTSSHFIALQLINPYPVPVTVNSNWCLATIDRSQMPTLTLTPITDEIPTFTIPAAVGNQPGSVVLEDGTAPSGFAQPPFVQLIPGLSASIGRELVILKPRRFDSVASKTISGNTSGDVFDESEPADLVPADQIDLTGTDTVPAGSNLYYRRAADGSMKTTSGASYAWNFVFPGKYNGYHSHNRFGPTTTPEGSTPSPFAQPIVIGPEPQNSGIVNPDLSKLHGGLADPTAISPDAPTFPTFTLQLNTAGLPGGSGVAPAMNKFPFGGFARNGDLLQVPFIGAYRIKPYNQPVSAGFVEMNSVTMDSSLADDQTLSTAAAGSRFKSSTATDAVNDVFKEQVGRFCPVGDTQPESYSSSATNQGREAAALMDFGTNPQYWHYHWSKRLFDYVTVQAPHDDYFPNVDPEGEETSISPRIPARYLPGDRLAINSQHCQVLPVANQWGAVANATSISRCEDTTGVEGLININTANWRVLSMLPWVPHGTVNVTDQSIASSGTDDNTSLAKAIVSYRNVNGPFVSIDDLYNVPLIRLENDKLITAGNLTALLGSVPAGIDNATALDFSGRFALINRVSNLVTTRSDTFTCYLLLQGWRNAGTPQATLAVERRAAFFADRNLITPTNPHASIFRIPTE